MRSECEFSRGAPDPAFPRVLIDNETQTRDAGGRYSRAPARVRAFIAAYLDADAMRATRFRAESRDNRPRVRLRASGLRSSAFSNARVGECAPSGHHLISEMSSSSRTTVIRLGNVITDIQIFFHALMER